MSVRNKRLGRQKDKRGVVRSDARPLLGLFGLSGAFFWNNDETTVLNNGRPLLRGPIQDHLNGLEAGRFQESIEWLLNGAVSNGFDKPVVAGQPSNFSFSLSQSLDVNQFLAVSLSTETPEVNLDVGVTGSGESTDIEGPSVSGEVVECGPAEEVVPGQPELECAPPDPLADEIFESFTGMPVALEMSGDVLSAAVSSTVFGGSGIYASSSSSTNISSSAVVSTAVSGAVIDGYVEGATVFADLNGDGIFNTGEPSAITDASGGYTLTTTSSLDGISIVSTGGTDVTTGATVDYMVAPAGVTYVTPISTLAHYSNEAGGDPLTLLADLGFTTEDLLVDPVVAGNEDFLAAGAGILTAVASASSLISGASGVEQSTVAQTVFNQLAQKDTATIKTLADRTDGAALSETELAEISSVMATLMTDAVAANSSFGSIDADVITTAAESIGQTIGALRQATDLSDVQVLASVGQAVMSTELKAIGEALKSGDADLETLKAGLSSKYGDADQIAKVTQGRQAALNSKNNAIDGVTIESDELTVTMASDGSLNPTVFLSTTGADNVLFDNDAFASSLDPTIIRVTNLGSSDISVDLTRMQLDGGLQFVFGDSFAIFDAEALDASSFSSATDIITLLTTASESFGDYYFEYAVDVGGQTATGLMTLHVVPEIQLDAVTSISVNEDAPILLSDLITSRTYGPGDRLVLEGLPEGTQIVSEDSSLTGSDDSDLELKSLDLTASTGALVIGPEWLLPWRFDDIEIVLPDNYKVDFTFELTLKAQYESASASSTDTVLVDLTAVSDGVDESNLNLATLTQIAVKPSRELVEGFSSNLFETTTGLIESLQAAQIDATEGLAVRIGVPSTGVTVSGATVSETIDDIDYYVLKDMPVGTLESQLQNLSLVVTDSTLAELAPSFAFGTFERGTTDIAWSSPTTQTLMVSGRAPLYYIMDAIALSSNDSGFDGMFSIDPLNLVPEAEQDPQILEFGDQQFIQLVVEVPEDFTVIRESGKTNWVEGATVGGVTTYSVSGVTLTAFYDGAVADLILKPADGFYTDPAGVLVSASVLSYVTDPTTDGLDPIGTPPTATLKVQPDIAAGSVDTSVAQIILGENQDDQVSDWMTLNNFITLDTLSDLPGATTELVLTLVDGLTSSLIQVRQDGVELPPVSSAGEHTFRLPITSTDLSSIEIQSPHYVSGTFTGEFYLETSVPGWPMVVSDSTVIAGEITPVVSGVDQEVVVATGYQGTEDTTFALSDLISTAATLLDTDGSETLVYQITLPTTVYLQTTTDGETRMLGGRLVDGERLFEIEASEIADYQALPKASFAGTSLDFSVTPIAIESDGSESSGTTQTGTFDILGVSEAPLVATPTILSELLTDTNPSISLPIVVSRQDPDETLSVTLDVTSNGNPVTDVILTINGTPYTPVASGLVTVATADIPFLSSMTITSSSDYRGAESLQIAVNASSQDGTATPALASVRTINVSIYQPVVAPTVTAVSSADGGEKFLDLTLDVSAAPTGIDQTDVTLLVTGVPSTTYFLDATDTPVGASLGGGVWLFNGSDVFDSGLSSSLQIIQTEGAAFDLSVKAILTDAVGGTSATSDASVATVDPLDPVVAVFGEAYPTVVADDVLFDFNTHSVLGDETALSWMVGDVSGGLPSGTAFFVQGESVAGYSDLFPSLDALISASDVNADGTVTLTEMASQNISLWFDSDTSGFLGEVDADELFAIESLLSDFTVTGSVTPVTSDYTTSQSALSENETITLIDQLSFNYTTTGGVSGSGEVFGTAIPFTTAFVSTLDPVNKPQAIISVPETVNEDSIIPVTIDFTAMDLSSNPSAAVVNLVKVYGVPEAAMLTGAVYVEGATAAESYWIAQVSEGLNPFDLKFSEAHVTGAVTLDVEPLVSVSDVTTMLFETVLGPTTSTQVEIVPQAETDLTIFRTDDTAVEMSEGGVLTLRDLDVYVMSPDSQETLFTQIEVANALTGEAIDTSSMFVLNGQPYTSYLTSTDGKLWIPASDVDVGLQVQLPEFFSDSFDITLTPVSRHGDDIAVGTNALTVPVTVNPAANGVTDVTLSIHADEAGTSTDFIEGQSLWLTPEATLVDPNESLIYQITVGGVGVDLTQIKTLQGQTATAIDSSNNVKVFEFDAEDILGPMELVTDTYFDGLLEIQVGAASIDPVSGNQSAYQVTSLQSITLTANPGNLATTVEFDVPDDLVDTVDHIRLSGSEEAIAGVESFNGVVTGTLSADGQSILYAPGDAGANTVGINPLMKESLTVELLDSTDSVLSTETMVPWNSFDVSFRQNGIRVEKISVTEGQPLSFDVRIQGYDRDESFDLTSTSGQFDITQTATGFTVSLASAPKPSELSVIDDLQLTINENGQSQSVTLPSLPVAITPVANGVENVALEVFADEAGTSTDFIEEQSLWLTPQATLVDASETLLYQLKVGGSQEALDAIEGLGSLVSIGTDGLYRVYELDATQAANPIELRLDSYYNGSVDLQLSAASYEPTTGEMSAYQSTEVINQPIQALPGNDGESYQAEYVVNGEVVEQLSVTEGQPLNFEVRVQGYDADETFSLISNSGQFDITQTPIGQTPTVFTVSLAAAPKPSELSLIDDLQLTINENGQSQTVTLSSLPVSITPIANGVEDVALAVFADEAGTSTDFIEGQSLWLTPQATPVDASETLVYQIKVGGPGIDLTQVVTLGGRTSTTINGDYKVFEVKASELDGPLELVLDPLFDNTLDIQVGAKSIDLVSGDETSFADGLSSVSSISLVGVPGTPSSIEYLQLVNGDWTSVSALSLTEGETNQTFKIRVTTEDLDETVGIIIPTALQSLLTIDTTSSTASEIALVVSEVPKPVDLGEVENLTLTVTESGLDRNFTLPSFPVSITPIANGVENLSVGLFADQALTDTEIRELGEIWVQPLGNPVDPDDSIHFTTIAVGGSEEAVAAITGLSGLSSTGLIDIDGQSFKVFAVSGLTGPYLLEIDPTYDGPILTATEAYSLDVGNPQNPSTPQQSSIGTAVILPTATDPGNVKLGQLNNDSELIDGISGIFGLAVDFIVRVTPQDPDESLELSLPNNVTLISGPTVQSSGDVDFNVRLEPEFFGSLEDAPEIFQIEGIQVISREGTDVSTYLVPTQDIAVNVNQAAAPVFSDLLTNPIRIEMPVNPDDLVAEAILNLEQFVVANKTDADFENDTTHYELSLASNTYLEKFGEGRDISLRYDADDFTRHGIDVEWDEEGKKYRFEGLRSVVTSPVVLSITTSLLADQAFAQAIFGDLKWTAVNTEPTTGLSKSTDIGLLLSKEVTGDVIVVDGEAVQVFFAQTFQNDVVEYRITKIGDQNIAESTTDTEQLGLLSDASLATVEATLTDSELGSITKQITSDVFVLPSKNQLGLSTADASDSLSNAVESYFESGYWGALGQATETVDSNQFTFIDPDFGIEEVGFGYEIGVSTLSEDSGGRLFADDFDNLNRIHGTQFNDFLVARAPDQTSDGSVLFGAGGTNTLLGNVGRDVLVSGGGRDVLTGNAGADIFQIVADTKNAETSIADLESALDQLLGGSSVSELATFTVQQYGSATQSTEQTDTLAEALRHIHSELEIDDAAVDLRAVVTDFSLGFDNLNSDRTVFTGIEDSESGAGKEISAHHLTWGANDYIYVVAQSMSEATSGNPNDAFVSALLIPEFSPVDIELTDLESAGIYAV